MKNYKKHFLRFAEERQALKFGEFTLKSGRISPYFFNAGTFYTGEALARLGRYYADAIVESGIEFDMLFGPAYKGIPLVAAVSVALAEHHGRDLRSRRRGVTPGIPRARASAGSGASPGSAQTSAPSGRTRCARAPSGRSSGCARGSTTCCSA